MPKPFFVANVVDLLRDGLIGLPDVTYRFVRQEYIRFLKRFKKKFQRERLSGPPGINAPKMRKGKHVYTWVDAEARNYKSLVAHAKIGKILKTHEKGATIHAKTESGYLFIGKGTEISAKVKQVKIPARLGFEAMWKSMIPDVRTRVNKAMARAVKVTKEKAKKKIINLAG